MVWASQAGLACMPPNGAPCDTGVLHACSYGLVDGECVQCEVEACLECNGNPGTCTRCDNGYGFVGGTCQKCAVPGCWSCDGDVNKCTRCQAIGEASQHEWAWAMDPATGQCTQASAGCRRCRPVPLPYRSVQYKSTISGQPVDLQHFPYCCGCAFRIWEC